MTASQVRDLPWGVWWAQVLAILRMEWRKNFLGRRSWWIYLAALAPVLLTGAHSAAILYRGSSHHGLANDTKVYAALFQLGYLRVFLFFGCALLFTNLFRGEVLNKTLHYYFLSPVRREVLAAGKFLSGLIAAGALFAASAALAHIALYLHFGAQCEEFYLAGAGLGHLLAYVSVSVLACFGYGAVFTLMGLLFRNPMVPAAVVMVWEAGNPFLPETLRRISVIFYLKSLCPVDVPVGGPLAFLASGVNPVSPWLAVPGLLVLSVAATACAAWRARTMEISYAE